MKKYISAQMNVVRLGNDIIVTSSTLGGLNDTENNTNDPSAWGGMDAPTRRYRENYDF